MAMMGMRPGKKVQLQSFELGHDHNRKCVICCQKVDTELYKRNGTKDNYNLRKKFKILCGYLNVKYTDADWNSNPGTGKLMLCQSCIKSTTKILHLHEQIAILKAKLNVVVENICKRLIFTSTKKRFCRKSPQYFNDEDGTVLAFHARACGNIEFRGLERATDPFDIDIIRMPKLLKEHGTVLHPIVSLKRLVDPCHLTQPSFVEMVVKEENCEGTESDECPSDTYDDDDDTYLSPTSRPLSSSVDLELEGTQEYNSGLSDHIDFEDHPPKCSKLTLKSSLSLLKNRDITTEFTSKFFTKTDDDNLTHKDFVVVRMNPDYKCSTCLIITKKLSRMATHIKNVHLGCKHECGECGKMYASKQHLVVHKKTVHESQVHECAVCKKPLKSIDSLRRHAWSHLNQEEVNSRIASGETNPLKRSRRSNHPCRFCGKCFGKQYLVLHEKKHSSIAEKKYICNKCPKLKRFWTEAQLAQHDRVIHLPDRNQFQCSVCLKGYPTRQRLEKHSWTHTGETPYVCPSCGKGFRSQTFYKAHQVTHQDETIRPFQCLICLKTYRWSTGLKNHHTKSKCGHSMSLA